MHRGRRAADSAIATFQHELGLANESRTQNRASKRSKVETTFHRYKVIVGSAMRARGLAAQRVEARIGGKILNAMTALGMPDSEMIG